MQLGGQKPPPPPLNTNTHTTNPAPSVACDNSAALPRGAATCSGSAPPQLHAALAHVHDGRAGSTQHSVFGGEEATSGLGQGEQARVTLQHMAASQPTYATPTRWQTQRAERGITWPSYSDRLALASAKRAARAASTRAGVVDMRAASSLCLHAWGQEREAAREMQHAGE
jgi:hypothetical protein